MSLLLDALKRAEEAKRAKLSSDRVEPLDGVPSDAPQERTDAELLAESHTRALEEMLAPAAAPAPPASGARASRPSRQPLAL